MKKILIIPISILLLTACATVKAPSPQTEGANSTQEITKEIPLSGRQQQLGEARGEQIKCDKKDERKCTIEIAKKIENIEIKNEFLWDYMYMLETQTKEDSIVCDEITKGSKDQASCHWILAMRLKDKSLCDKIMPYTSATKENEVTNAGNCKNEISYKTANTDWKLEGGIPPYADPTPLTYTGKAQLKGWIVNVPFYVSNPEPHFHVAKESIKDLPLSMQLNGREDFILEVKGKDGKYLKAESQWYKDMKQYNEKNPVTIEINRTGFAYMEGSPFMQFVQTVNP